MTKSKNPSVNAYLALMNQWVAKQDNEHADQGSLIELGRQWALLSSTEKVEGRKHNTNGSREAHG